VPTVHARAVKRAAELCGDEELAFQLGVSLGELKLWMLGLNLPPDAVFVRIVDIISAHDLNEIRKNNPKPNPGQP
jgi:hypothetical protein